MAPHISSECLYSPPYFHVRSKLQRWGIAKQIVCMHLPTMSASLYTSKPEQTRSVRRYKSLSWCCGVFVHHSCLSLSAKEILIGCLLSLRPLLLAGALKILAAPQLLWNRARSVSGRRDVSSTVRAAGKGGFFFGF